MEFQTRLHKFNPIHSRFLWIHWVALGFAAIELGAIIGCAPARSPVDPAAEEIRHRITFTGNSARIPVGSDSVFSVDLVRQFYDKRSCSTAWSTSEGLLEVADSLLQAICAADREGLTPEEYHLAAIEAEVVEINRSREMKVPIRAERRAELDLLLTDAFLLYASHLSEGRIDQETLKIRSCVRQNETRYSSLLEQALQSHRMRENLQSLSPRHKLYSDLRVVLAALELMSEKGGWGVVPPGPILKEGDEGKRVLAVKRRFRVSGDFTLRSNARSDRFDSTLVEDVRIFQKRYGIEASGCVDSVTVAAMNVPLDKRIKQVIVTMERWRWMQHDLGNTYVRINIPDFRLAVFENEKEVVGMKVVLGLPGWQTPVFTALMTQVLINSPWIAPEDIVERELINYMKADSNYLRSNKMTLWRSKGDSLEQVDPRSINWPKMNDKNIDFRLRQDAGPENIMGQVKFLIPNKYNIYLHDTPYREDFPKAVRMFSHGCIRLEKPLELAEYVLRDHPGWKGEKIDSILARKIEQSFILRSPIPVYVFYATVWKEPDGSTQFRDDIYGLDRKLLSALGTTHSNGKKEFPVIPPAASTTSR